LALSTSNKEKEAYWFLIQQRSFILRMNTESHKLFTVTCHWRLTKEPGFLEIKKGEGGGRTCVTKGTKMKAALQD